MVASILDRFGNEVSEMTIIPSAGGAYNVWKDDQQVFSKHDLGRFPHSDDEVIQHLT